MTKAGISGHDVPTVFPSVAGGNHRESFVGFDTVKCSRSGMHLALEHPVRQGIVRNWDAMEQVNCEATS